MTAFLVGGFVGVVLVFAWGVWKAPAETVGRERDS